MSSSRDDMVEQGGPVGTTKKFQPFKNLFRRISGDKPGRVKESRVPRLHDNELKIFHSEVPDLYLRSLISANTAIENFDKPVASSRRVDTEMESSISSASFPSRKDQVGSLLRKLTNAGIRHREYAMKIQQLYRQQLDELLYTYQLISQSKISLKVVHRLSATLDRISQRQAIRYRRICNLFSGRVCPPWDFYIATWLNEEGNTLGGLISMLRPYTSHSAKTWDLDEVVSHEDWDSSAPDQCSTDTEKEEIIAYIQTKLFTATQSIPMFPRPEDLDESRGGKDVRHICNNIHHAVRKAKLGSGVLFICPNILHHIGISKARTRENVICDVLLISEKAIPVLLTHLYRKDDTLWSSDHGISQNVCDWLSKYGCTSPALKHVRVVGFDNLKETYFSTATENIQPESSGTPQINEQVMTQMLYAMASCTYDAHFSSHNEEFQGDKTTDSQNAFPSMHKIDKDVSDRNQDTSMAQPKTTTAIPGTDFRSPIQEQSKVQQRLLEDRVLYKYRVHRHGGIVDFPNGVQLFVPANAFSVGEHRDILVGTTENGMDQPTLQPGQRQVTPVIVISPHDMVFEKPAVLSIPHGQNFKSSEDAIADLVILHSQTEIGVPVRWCRWDNSNTGDSNMFAFMTKDHVILVLTHFCFFTVAMRNCGSVEARSLRILTCLETIPAMGHSLAKLTVIAVDDDEPHVFEKRFPHLNYGQAVCNHPFVVYNTGMDIHIKIENILPPWIVQNDTCREKYWSFIHLWQNLCPNHTFCIECNQECPQLFQCQIAVYQEPNEQGIADKPILMTIAATVPQVPSPICTCNLNTDLFRSGNGVDPSYNPDLNTVPATRLSPAVDTNQTMEPETGSPRDLSVPASERSIPNDDLKKANGTNDNDNQQQLPSPLQTSIQKSKYKCGPTSPQIDHLQNEMGQMKITSEYQESPRTGDQKPKIGPQVRDLEDDVSLVPTNNDDDASSNAGVSLLELEPRNDNLIMLKDRRNNRIVATESVQRIPMEMVQRQCKEGLMLPASGFVNHLYEMNYKQLCDLFYIINNREPRNGHIPFSLMKQLATLLDDKHPLGNDWRMLADHMNLSHVIRRLENNESPTTVLLIVWQAEKRTLGDLKDMMTQIRRSDVVQEIENFDPSHHSTGPPEIAHIPQLRDNNNMLKDAVTC